jgi:hypothetical protein
MKATKNLVLLLVALALISTTLYGLVKVDSLALSPNGNFIIPAGEIVDIVAIGNPSCAVFWNGQLGVIPCANIYFMGRWGRGSVNRSPAPR